ncbi:MAG TPA: FAD-binding oxidoreductase, partial [Thermoanaerobaculia bacterium]
LATNGFGPLRTRYGTLRDLVLGVTLVRADGTVARAGGKVVKNVAGFDLPKMVVGSLGTLGLIATATFRLHPLPERVVTLLVPGRTAKEVRTLTAALRQAQLEPAAVAALSVGGKFEAGIRFEGFGAGVSEQVERARVLAANGGRQDCTLLDEDAAKAFWAGHEAARVAGPLRARIALLPSSFEEFFERCSGALLRLLDAPAVVLYPTLGISFFSGVPSPDLAALAAALASARAALAARGGSLVLEEAPAEIRARVDVWGPPPAAFGLMRRLKERLDPDALLNPGRFTGGI